MSHIKIIYSGGYQDARMPIRHDLLALTPNEFRRNTDVLALKRGAWVTMDSEGFVTLPKAGSPVIGMLIDDTSGHDFDNLPAYASGFVACNIGSALIETDVVEEDDLKAGELLFVNNFGVLTRVGGSNATPLGIVKEGNTPTDKTITFYKN
jgi:hypothetical protein